MSILFAVPEPRPAKPDVPVHPLGIDRNVKQIARSTKVIRCLPDVERLYQRLAHLQRKLARQQPQSKRRAKTKLQISRVYRKIRNIIKNWCHQVSRELANAHDRVILEALNIKGMTRSAHGAVDKPGKHAAQKRGRNRSILRSGWGRLERYMTYKTHIHKIDPAYTSQACSHCGEVRKANRKSRSDYHCRACGMAKNADINAAMNILMWGLREYLASGVGASARDNCG